MGVDGEGQVLHHRGHLHGQDALGDQLAGARTGDADAEDPLGGGLDDQLGEAVAAAEGDGAARGGPREARDRHLDALLAGLGLGEAAPGDLGVGVDDAGDGVGLVGGAAAGDDLRGDRALVGSGVGQGRADDVADGEDRRLRGAALGVDLDEPLRVEGGPGALQAQVLGVRAPAHGQQHAVPGPGLGRPPGRRLPGHLQAPGGLGRGGDGALQVDRLELLLQLFYAGRARGPGRPRG